MGASLRQHNALNYKFDGRLRQVTPDCENKIFDAWIFRGSTTWDLIPNPWTVTWVAEDISVIMLLAEAKPSPNHRDRNMAKNLLMVDLL